MKADKAVKQKERTGQQDIFPAGVSAVYGKGLRKRIIILSIVIAATLTVIWGHSFLSPEDSARESGYFFELLRPFVEFFIGAGNFTELFVRKAAHFTEFFILGCELILMMRYLIFDRNRENYGEDGQTGSGEKGQTESGESVQTGFERKEQMKSGENGQVGFRENACRKRILIINAWSLGTFCAFIDETIQIFSGRGASVADIWLDSAGCLSGVLIFGLLFVLSSKKCRNQTQTS